MRSEFRHFDKDRDGRLSATEVLTMLGDHPDSLSEANRSAISSMLESLGSVDFDEFVGLWEMVTGMESDEEEGARAQRCFRSRLRTRRVLPFSRSTTYW